MRQKGNLFVISGFSGAGKGTLMKELINRYDSYALSVSVTSRAPRAGEVHGREYFFIEHSEFERMAAAGELMEYAIYVDHGYGTPAFFVNEKMEAGLDVLLEIEIQGAMQIREKFPEATLIFITPPSAKELRRRLYSRGTETPEVIEARLFRAVKESSYMEHYDHILVNDNLDACVSELHALIRSRHSLVSQNLSLIEQIKTQLNAFSKGE